MALAHTPLDPTTLSAAAQKALGPGPARAMAARGLAPLPDPVDLVAVLYQLSLDKDAALRDAAVATLDNLPDKVLSGAIASPRLDPRPLDLLARRAERSPALIEALILNPSTADATVASLAARAGSKEIDLIAQNEQRLLRHPEVIGAMYTNSKARMSTVDRAVELAVRNGLKVPGIAAWEELSRAILGGPGAGKDPVAPLPAAEADALFARAARTVTETDDSALTTGDVEAMSASEEQKPAEEEVEAPAIPISQMTVPMKIRLATMGNAFARAVLVRDPLRLVAMAAIKSPGVREMEVARYASNQGLNEDVIKYIAGRREWTKMYGVKLALVQNAKCPIPEAIRLMPHLREKDLRIISKSRGVSSAVTAQARKLVLARTRPDEKKK